MKATSELYKMLQMIVQVDPYRAGREESYQILMQRARALLAEQDTDPPTNIERIADSLERLVSILFRVAAEVEARLDPTPATSRGLIDKFFEAQGKRLMDDARGSDPPKPNPAKPQEAEERVLTADDFTIPDCPYAGCLPRQMYNVLVTVLYDLEETFRTSRVYASDTNIIREMLNLANPARDEKAEMEEARKREQEPGK